VFRNRGSETIENPQDRPAEVLAAMIDAVDNLDAVIAEHKVRLINAGAPPEIIQALAELERRAQMLRSELEVAPDGQLP